MYGPQRLPRGELGRMIPASLVTGGSYRGSIRKRRWYLLTSREILESIISGSAGEGPMSLTHALSFARTHSFSGIGHAKEKQGDFYLLFLEGDPNGAVLHDSKGALFGNKAVYLMKGTEQFTLFPVRPEIVERLILGCRIFDQEILRRILPVDIPEVKREREGGAGIFSVVIVDNGRPLAGHRVSIRKEGQVIGNDFTRADGKVSFRLLYGKYECVVHSRDLTTRMYEFEFHPGLNNKPVTLDIGNVK